MFVDCGGMFVDCGGTVQCRQVMAHGGGTILPFSGELESKLQDMGAGAEAEECEFFVSLLCLCCVCQGQI